MAEGFDSLLNEVSSEWDDATRAVHEAASRTFENEMRLRSSIGSQLRQARTEKSLSQLALASMSGIQQAEISRIECGVANATLATVAKLAEHLDLDLRLEARA